MYCREEKGAVDEHTHVEDVAHHLALADADLEQLVHLHHDHVDGGAGAEAVHQLVAHVGGQELDVQKAHQQLHQTHAERDGLHQLLGPDQQLGLLRREVDQVVLLVQVVRVAHVARLGPVVLLVDAAPDLRAGHARHQRDHRERA